MVFRYLILAFFFFASLSHALPFSEKPRATNETTTSSLSVRSNSIVMRDVAVTRNSYKLFTGSGQDWPNIDQWVSYDQMVSNNMPILRTSCRQWQQADNTEEEINDILAGINAQAKESGVDKRFILATIMQESGGCVRVPISRGSVDNSGLMQDHDGKAMCNANHIGSSGGHVSSPCPAEQISKMILEGTAGTETGNGLVQSINKALELGGSGGMTYYLAARLYNSGPNSYAAGSDLGTPQWGTSCYSTDMANRLLGWAEGASSCDLPNPH